MSESPAKITYLPDTHRALPVAAEAEFELLGAYAIFPKEVGAMCAARGVQPNWFLIPAHAEVYGILSELNAAGKPIDLAIILTILKDRQKLEAVGGFPFISKLLSFPTAANAAHHLEIVERKYQRRQTIAICTQYCALAYDGAEDEQTLLAGLHGAVTGILHQRSKRASIRDTVREILHEIISGQPDGTLLKTGMNGVDGRLKIYRGDLLMISAPTSCGKSALAFNLALNVAMQGNRVGLYPLEMRQKQSLKRAMAQLGGYNPEFVRKLTIEAETFAQKEAAKKAQDAISLAAQTILGCDIHMRDDLTRFEAIAADIRAESAQKKFDFIVIDYLQLIRVSTRYERRQLEIAAITQQLKALANELDCVVCVPSQVNKEGGTREAEDAENDASALIKIHAEKNDKGDIHPGRVEVWKQREGARHIDLPLTFNGLLTRFEYTP